MCTYCVLGTARAEASAPVKVLPDLGHESPMYDLHPHRFPRWARTLSRHEHIVIGHRAQVRVTIDVVLQELLGHEDRPVTLSAEVAERTPCYCRGQCLPGVTLRNQNQLPLPPPRQSPAMNGEGSDRHKATQ